MREIGSIDESLNRAFKLAYFILGDRSASIYVAMAAMSKLKAASTNQGRRLYYKPMGRSSYPATRTKVNLSNLHLLQRLVYIESELFERLIEGQRKALSQADLVIRYIKHLVKITTRHNSFYVTLGVCRLLYNYSTSETSDIYNLVLQDPERIRDDYYYRSRKKRLMEEIKDRFGSLVRTQRASYGEERFVPQADSQEYGDLVRQSLIRFTPWHSPCVLPHELDPNRNIISDLLFAGKNPDLEHEIELNRIHTLVHPECLERLTAALELAPPEKRLDLPFFFLTNGRPSPTEDRFNPPALTEGELEAIRSYLDKKPRRHKSFSSGSLRLVIDGKSRAAFNLERSRSMKFELDNGTELVEVRYVGSYEEEGDISVAVWLLRYEGWSILPANYSVKFGKGRLSLRVLPLTNADGETQGATLTLNHSTQRSTSAIVTSLSMLRTWLSESVDSHWRRGFGVAPAAIALTFAALCVTALWLYLQTVKPPNRSEVAQLEKRPGVEPSPFSSPGIELKGQSGSAGPGKNVRQSPTNSLNVTRRATTVYRNRAREAERVRGLQTKPASLSLAIIKRVYVDVLGDDSFSRQLREDLTRSLRTSNRFEVVQNREECDAVFKGSAIQAVTPGTRFSIKLELVNAGGEVVWFLSTKRGKALPRESTKASASILAFLLHDIEEIERKQ